MKSFSFLTPLIRLLRQTFSLISTILSRPAGYRFLISYVVLLELAVSQVVLYRLVFDSAKYTLGEALLSQPILWLEAGGWAFLVVFLIGTIKWTWLRRLCSVLLLTVATLLTLGEFLLLWVYDTVYNPEMSKVIVGTDARESLEFLSAMSHHLPKLLLAAAVMCGAAWALSKALSTLRSRFIAAIGLCCFVLGFGLSVGRYRNWHWSYSPARTTTADRFVWGLVRTYRLGKILTTQREHMHASAAKTVTGHFDTGITQPINVVLILGESTRAASMHCYGYALPTTPQLDQLHAQKELAVFTDAVSPSNATIASTQAVLTFYTNEQDKARWHEYPDLVSVMKHGGFATAWVTNQECSGGPWSVQQLFGPPPTPSPAIPTVCTRPTTCFCPIRCSTMSASSPSCSPSSSCHRAIAAPVACSPSSISWARMPVTPTAIPHRLRASQPKTSPAPFRRVRRKRSPPTTIPYYIMIA